MNKVLFLLKWISLRGSEISFKRKYSILGKNKFFEQFTFRSKQAQMHNEGTPEKSSPKTVETSPFSKARTNLSIKFANTPSKYAENVIDNNDLSIKHMNEAVDLLDIDEAWENCDIVRI